VSDIDFFTPGARLALEFEAGGWEYPPPKTTLAITALCEALAEPFPTDEALLREALYALEYASDMTKPAQTRRIIKPQPQYRHGVLFPQGSSTGCSPSILAGACPYGRPGDRLWVREQIHGGGSWEKSPWVWAIEVKKLEQQEQA